MEATLKRYCCFLWLAADMPERVEQTLAESTWMPPEGVFHLQHWFELEARCDLALYRGASGEALSSMRDRFTALEGSLLLRVQIVRSIYRGLMGRLLIASASAENADQSARRVHKLAKQLEGEGIGYARVWGMLLRAGLEARVGRTQGAEAFAQAEQVAREYHMRLCAAVARRRRGELTDGEAGTAWVREADSWMSGQGVSDPARLTEVYAPLFEAKQ
jgi:hypothetical protein